MSLTAGMVGHIVMGGAGLISGFAVFVTKKGSPNHILIGRIYTISMMLMAMSGFYYAWIRSVHITMFASCLTGYLVLTSWLLVQRSFQRAWVRDYLPALIGLPLVSYAAVLSWNAFNGITDELGSFVVPAIKYYEFAVVIVIAFSFDVLAVFGKRNTPKKRINQHLWRMAFPLYIACSSLFEGQARLFPESLRYTFWLSLPEKVALLLMFYWLFKDYLDNLKQKLLPIGVKAR